MGQVKLKKPDNNKERNLLKGSLRRLFSRSDIRRSVIDDSRITGYHNLDRPRVTKWSYCSDCNKNVPTYLMECDHIEPIIKIGEALENLSWDTVIERIWCAKDNLRAVCKDCHKIKSKKENAERRRLKKEAKNEKI